MVKPSIILREKGLNPYFKLEGSNFKGSLLDLLNEFYYLKVLGFDKGKLARCFKEDPADDYCKIPMENRWHIGDTILIEKINFEPWGIFLENKEGQTLNITRAEMINGQ